LAKRFFNAKKVEEAPEQLRPDMDEAYREMERYSSTGDVTALNNAAAAWDRVLNSSSFSDSDAPFTTESLNDAADVLDNRFEVSGSLAEATWDRVLSPSSFSDSTPPLPTDILNGSLVDLDRSIELRRRAVQGLSRGSSELPRYLLYLSASLVSRFHQTEELPALDEALAHLRSALQVIQPDSEWFPFVVRHLGFALTFRHLHTSAPEDLNEAIEYHRTAVQQHSLNSAELRPLLTAFAVALHKRFLHTGRCEDLEDAVSISRRAVKITPADSPELPGSLNCLADVLSDRYTRTGQRQDLDDALAAYKRASDIGGSSSYHMMRSAFGWADCAFQILDWNQAATAYRRTLDAAEQVLNGEPSRVDQKTWLVAFQGYPMRAAYAFAKVGRERDAILVLERGRARLVTEVLEQRRAALERLRESGHEELREKFTSAASWLDTLQRSEEVLAMTPGLPRPPKNRLSSELLLKGMYRKQLNEAIEAIREISGFEDFYRPVTLERIERSLLPGTVYAYIVTTAIGSLTLTVRAKAQCEGNAVQEVAKGQMEITPVWQDAFREADIDAMLVTPESGDDYDEAAAYPNWLSGASKDGLPKILYQLGQKLMAPLAVALREICDGPREHIGTTAKGEKPRVVIIPTGRLNFLPMHAAHLDVPARGLADASSQDNETVDPLPNVFLDEFVVSYGISALALFASHENATARQSIPLRLAGVGNPLPAAKALDPLQSLLRDAVRSLPESEDIRDTRAHFAQVLELESTDLLHRGNYLKSEALKIFAQIGAPAEDLVSLSLMWPVTLPYARAEIQSIAAMFPKSNVQVFYEQQATCAPILKALPSASVVHFACHGAFNPVRPLESGLVFADKGLTLREILWKEYSVFKSARLVILSACQTALQDWRELTDEAIGLVGALTQAGVPAVLGSLWSVGDASTALLMLHFYELLLRSRLAPSVALHESQRWLRSATKTDLEAYLSRRDRVGAVSDGSALPTASVSNSMFQSLLAYAPEDRPYADPVYWAGFILYGTQDALL
jgi:tetratricopeptide (TPR) repeat protein